MDASQKLPTGFPKAISPNQKDFIDIGNNTTLLKYFQKIQKHFIYANNFGMALDDDDNLSSTGKSILLEKIFVAPHLSQKHITPNQLITAEVEEKDVESSGIIPVLKNHQRLFILGDPGAGKSTLVSWLMLALSSTTKSKIKLTIGNTVPFVMILREMSFENINSWDALCQQSIKSELANPFLHDQTTFAQLLNRGQALFLLDGLDEITLSRYRKKLSNIIQEGMKKYPACRFIITSRIVGFNQLDWFDLIVKSTKKPNEIRENNFNYPLNQPITETYLSPFNKQQATQFVHNWYSQYVTAAQGCQKLAQSLIERLTKNDGLSQLSRIPVLLNMICFIHARRGRLPDGRAELYQRIAETYLTGLDKARDIKFKGDVLSFDYLDLSDWLSQLALKIQKNRTKASQAMMISESEVREILQEGLLEKGFDEEKADKEAKNIINYLAQRSGIFIPRGNDTNDEEQYAFTHLSFLEYFAARGMKTEAQFWDKEWSDYKVLTKNVWWSETFILFFEQLENTRQTHHYLSKLFGDKPLDFNEGRADKILLAEIVMDTSVRLPSKDRKEWIKKLWQGYLGFVNDEKSKLYFGLEKMTEKLWADFFDSKAIFYKEIESFTTSLSLAFIPITNLSFLSELKNLSTLYLNGTKISDLSPLLGLKNLKKVIIPKSQKLKHIKALKKNGVKIRLL